MKLTFWGAAQVVTGSMHELTLDGRRYLLDCGLFQGSRAEAWERNSHFPFAGDTVEAVLLSHAHTDHSGNLPGLHRNGFNGPIYTTPTTTDLCRAMLLDSAHIQESDVVFINKRLQRRITLLDQDPTPEQEPLYTTEDVNGTLPLFRSVPLGQATEIAPGLQYQSFDAGHMLGSTFMRLTLDEGGTPVRLLFSGDVGRKNLPIIPDPVSAQPAEYLIMESTYGDRLHKATGPVLDRLATIINRAVERRGKIIVPAFAVGRTQQLIVLLHDLLLAGRIRPIPMYVDSPLAVNISEIYQRHTQDMDPETLQYERRGLNPFIYSNLRYVRNVSESKALNDIDGPFLVISASGMCEAGRVLHHLRHNVGDPRALVLITGYQAQHTLGRRLLDGERTVRIFGEPHQVRCEVAEIDELSGHADQHELLEWMQPAVATLKRVFLVHGEPPAQQALAKEIRDRYNLDVVIPAKGDSYDLT